MASVSHPRNLNGPGVRGSNKDATSSYPAPGSGNNHNPKSGTSIHGGTFIGGNVNSGETGAFTQQINIHAQLNDGSGLHILYHSAALEATHDSADNYAQPRCHPETCTEMLEKLYNWCIRSEWPEGSEGESEELDSEQCPVLWLYGPAGAGKSAIMRTLAEQLATSGQLGGSFFFKRGH
jgi:hypothetical protein